MSKVWSAFSVHKLIFLTRHVKAQGENEVIIASHNLGILDAFSRIKSSLRKADGSGNFLYFNNHRRRAEILSIDFSGNVVKFLIKLSNKDMEQPSVTNFNTNQIQEIQKTDDDGGDVISRVLLKINDNDKFSAIFAAETKTGVNKALIYNIIKHYLDIDKNLNPDLYLLPHPSGFLGDDGNPQMLSYRYLPKILGLFSEQLRNAIENDDVLSFFVTEIIPERQHDGTDIMPLHHKVLSFKPKLANLGGDAVRKFVAEAKRIVGANTTQASNYKTKIEYRLPNSTKTKTIEINPFSDDLVDAFTHKIYVDITSLNVLKYEFVSAYSKLILDNISELESYDNTFALESPELFDN